MAGITPAYDAMGFQRLGQMKIDKRSEAREERRLGIAEKSANQNLQLGQMQITQMKRNLSAIKKQEELKIGLGKALSNIPEGENQYTTGYNYLMMQGAPEMAQKYADGQSDRIEQIFKMDPERGIETFNNTIGKTMGTTLKYKEKDKTYGDVFEAIDDKTGNLTYLQKTSKGFEPIEGYSPAEDETKDPIIGDMLTLTDDNGNLSYGHRTKSGKFIQFELPPGLSIETMESGHVLSDTEVNFLAEKYIVDGKKPFPVRGKEANAKNAQVIQRSTNMLIGRGVAPDEATFNIKDREGIIRSLQAQEKQRGSMISFVENLGKQVDHVATVAEEIKSFDTRLFNKPAIWIRKKLAGSPEFSKYEVYLGEIQSEIGKLSSGSTASVSELSEGAREKWEKILDENLSIKDMLEVLEEVKEAGNIRMESVDYGINETKKRLRNVGKDDEKTMPVNELSDDALLEMLNAN